MKPDHTVPVPYVTCASCWSLFRVRGDVRVVVAADGTELWLFCACGSNVARGQVHQQDLFGGTA